MLPITLADTSFKFGPLDIPYANVSGAGVAVQERRHAVYRSLLIAYQLPGEPKPRKILFRLKPGAEGQQLVDGFRARVADRWKGESPLFEMNKRLGFSNKTTFVIVGVIVAVTVVAVLGWAMSLKHGDAPPRHPDTPAHAPKR